jgi:S-adenosylmethionine:tRNA ribosyltransferase-isomerase
LDPVYLEKNAEVPLPGYILKARKRSEGPENSAPDESSYQTVFANEPGSIAAPTAGFHFTPELLARIKFRGVEVRHVTLHIGWGTFKPVRSEDPAAHTMLEEDCSVTEETASAVNAAREKGGRIIAVGTSSMRTLETFSDDTGRLSPGTAKAGLFIYPGYRFKVADAFITNLHVPSSAPLYMTAAFAGRERLFMAYTEAVEKKYRFYSYGDAMFIV